MGSTLKASHTSTHVPSRYHLLYSPCLASPALLCCVLQTLSHLSADPVFLSTLNTWLADLVVERSDANLHVLLKVLEVLAMLKGASWAGLTASGLCVTVKKAAGHRNRDVLNKSTALLKVRRVTGCMVYACAPLPLLLVPPPVCASGVLGFAV